LESAPEPVLGVIVFGSFLKEPGNNLMAIAWQHLANNHYQNEYLGRYLYIKVINFYQKLTPVSFFSGRGLSQRKRPA